VIAARALNGARQNRLDAALSRLAEVEESTLKQLSDTEDADIAKTLIDFSSQQAAYQAALKAGASIVQASLMDFLR
jgi:flagellar hook-associated protein 3 FlgL